MPNSARMYVAWRRFRSGLTGRFRYGALVGALFVLAVQACYTVQAENRADHKRRLQEYEELLRDPARLDAEWRHWQRWVHETPWMAGEPTDKETFVRNRHPWRNYDSSPPPGWWLVFPPVLLAAVLLVNGTSGDEDDTSA